MMTPMLYSGLTLDRAHRLRREAQLDELARSPLARFSLYWRGKQLVSGEPPRAVWRESGPMAEMLDALAPPMILLGLDGAAPLLAADLSALEGGEDGPDLGDGTWVSLRAVGARLPAAEAALLAYARGVLVWRDRTRFCSVCGAPLVVADAGHSTRCGRDSCAALHFPRTDPAMIVLATDPDGRALLGRQAAWPPGMYSCLAGFIEPGESLEEAVAREVWEEAGIKILSASYAASQPWPFPSSLMVGFFAAAEAGEPAPDRTEIEDARWFTRAEVAQFGEANAPGRDGLFLPNRDSIARALIQQWLAGD